MGLLGASLMLRRCKEYRDSYGITLGKWSLMFVPRPVKYSKIDLPIAALQLEVKRKLRIKGYICYLWHSPKELTIYFENAKYTNKNEGS